MSLLSSLSSLDVCLTGLITSPSQLVSAAFSVKILNLNLTGASLNSHSQFSHSVMSDSLRPHRLHYARPPCPTSAPRAYSNSCPLSWWCHPTISSYIVPFSWLQSFPASRSFPVSEFFASGGKSIGVSASASVFPMNIQDRFSLGWTGCISLQSKGLSRDFSNTTFQNHQFFGAQISL